MILAEAPLSLTQPFSALFRSRGAENFGDAVSMVRRLPYGRNSNRADPLLVLPEGRGTCSTKHALLALLAAELNLPVTLKLCIYEMTAENTPGVGAVLRDAGLHAIPEAHCYLQAGDTRIDVIRAAAGSAPLLGVTALYEEAIAPAQIGTYKVTKHREFVAAWATARGLDPVWVWEVRERCIAGLGARTTETIIGGL